MTEQAIEPERGAIVEKRWAMQPPATLMESNLGWWGWTGEEEGGGYNPEVVHSKNGQTCFQVFTAQPFVYAMPKGT